MHVLLAVYVLHLSIYLAFLHDNGTWIPWQRSHHLRECTVAFSNGSCKIACEISFSVSSRAEVASSIKTKVRYTDLQARSSTSNNKLPYLFSNMYLQNGTKLAPQTCTVQ